MPALAAADAMIYTYVAVALVAGAAAFTTAWKVQAWRFDSAKLEAIDRACLADDGVRVLNAAVATTGDTAIPGNPMPAASATR